MSLTPEQQANYDYAMSLIKPKIHGLSPLKNIVLNLKVDSSKFEAAIKAATMAAYAAGASIRAMMQAPNCRCTIMPNILTKSISEYYEHEKDLVKKRQLIEATGMKTKEMSIEQIENLYQAIMDAQENIANQKG